MITATVKLTTAGMHLVYQAVGFSLAAIEDSALELAGDEPCGLTVLVH